MLGKILEMKKTKKKKKKKKKNWNKQISNNKSENTCKTSLNGNDQTKKNAIYSKEVKKPRITEYNGSKDIRKRLEIL